MRMRKDLPTSGFVEVSTEGHPQSLLELYLTFLEFPEVSLESHQKLLEFYFIGTEKS